MRDGALFVLIALLPAIALGALAFRALRNEEAAVRREMNLELERTAASTRVLYAAELAKLAEPDASPPPFADAVSADAEATPVEQSRQTSDGAACHELAADLRARGDGALRARILRECRDATNESGRFVWPLVAFDPRTDARPTPAELESWLKDHASRMSSAERAATRLEIDALVGFDETQRSALARALDVEAAPSRAYLGPRRLAMAAGVPRIEWDDASSWGNLRLVSPGRYQGYVVHPGSLRRALKSGWPPLGDAMAAHLVVGREAKDAPAVELLRGGAWLVIGWADADAVARTAERSRAVLIGAAVIAGVAAMMLAALLFTRMRAERRLSALRTDFVAAVSHELRTPIASLRMLSELLAEGRVEEAERDDIQRALVREARRLGDTVERLLGFSRMEAGKTSSPREERPVAEIVARAIDTFEERHPNGTRIERELDPDATAAVDADALLMAIDNLLSNARKYAPDGTPYRVRVERDKREVRIAVIDRGPGIARRDQQRIFRPFERADDRLSRATEGSGIGLSLVRHVARTHGGDVTVESSPGHGASFVIHLPGGDA